MLSIFLTCTTKTKGAELLQHCIKTRFRSLKPDGNQIQSFYVKAQLTFCCSIRIHFEMMCTEKQKALHRLRTLPDRETERESEWWGEGGIGLLNERFFVCLDKGWQDSTIKEDREVQPNKKQLPRSLLVKHCQNQRLLSVSKHSA